MKVIKFLAKVFGIGLFVVVVNYLCNQQEIYQIIDQKIIPILVGIVGAIASMFSLLKPIFSKLDLSQIGLKESLNECNRVIKENNFIKAELHNSLKKIECLEKEVNTLINMVKIGFSQDESLVKSGKANLICKEVEKDET
ncbi:MAG: hypothetical protein IJW82_07335 [Clostridia bacterium]|nr:hypothetical protein [Clostridia bacterium]